MNLRTSILLTGCLAATAAYGGKVADVRVGQEGDYLTMHSEVVIPRMPAQVHEVLTDFERLGRINGELKNVEILGRQDDGRARMRVVARVCVLFVCLDFVWVQQVYTDSSGDIVADIEPGTGDFRSGQARWHMLAEDRGTRLVFDARLEPDFWFPPLIGRWLMERKLRNEAMVTATGIERVTPPP
jgi:hypothetical protein